MEALKVIDSTISTAAGFIEFTDFIKSQQEKEYPLSVSKISKKPLIQEKHSKWNKKTIDNSFELDIEFIELTGYFKSLQ